MKSHYFPSSVVTVVVSCGFSSENKRASRPTQKIEWNETENMKTKSKFPLNSSSSVPQPDIIKTPLAPAIRSLICLLSCFLFSFIVNRPCYRVRNEIYTCWMCIFPLIPQKNKNSNTKSWGDFHFQGIELQTTVVVSSRHGPRPRVRVASMFTSMLQISLWLAARLPFFNRISLTRAVCCVERCNNDAIRIRCYVICRYCGVPLIIADDFIL